MYDTRRKAETKYGSLTLTDQEVIRWFISHDVEPERQDEWIQEVTGRETAVVSGYSLSSDPLELSIDYEYIGEVEEVTAL